jgi:hypothetical protein
VIFIVVTAIYALEMATAAKARLTFRIGLCRTSKMYGKPPRCDYGSLSTLPLNPDLSYVLRLPSVHVSQNAVYPRVSCLMLSPSSDTELSNNDPVKGLVNPSAAISAVQT